MRIRKLIIICLLIALAISGAWASSRHTFETYYFLTQNNEYVPIQSEVMCTHSRPGCVIIVPGVGPVQLYLKTLSGTFYPVDFD